MKEIVIKVDDNLYERIKNLKKLETIYCCTPLVEAVKNGTELPKGHDGLVDKGKMWDAYHDMEYDFYDAYDVVEVLVEADKGEE